MPNLQILNHLSAALANEQHPEQHPHWVFFSFMGLTTSLSHQAIAVQHDAASNNESPLPRLKEIIQLVVDSTTTIN